MKNEQEHNNQNNKYLELLLETSDNIDISILNKFINSNPQEIEEPESDPLNLDLETDDLMLDTDEIEDVLNNDETLEPEFIDSPSEVSDIHSDKEYKNDGLIDLFTDDREQVQPDFESLNKKDDYKHGIARVKCTNSECSHDFFVPFSCKQFLFCPSCSQKRTLLFGEYLTYEVLLRLPHKFFTFTPKSLRIFLKNDKYLFSELSKLIYILIEGFYTEAAGKRILSSVILVYQSFGDMIKFFFLFLSYKVKSVCL